MGIETVKEFRCPLCGYITRDTYKIKRIEQGGKCPACNNKKSGL